MIDLEMLNHIPADCSYDEWLKVGMALKHDGADLSVWDRWSSGGRKYKRGECEKKWRSFNRNDVTGVRIGLDLATALKAWRGGYSGNSVFEDVYSDSRFVSDLATVVDAE